MLVNWNSCSIFAVTTKSGPTYWQRESTWENLTFTTVNFLGEKRFHGIFPLIPFAYFGHYWTIRYLGNNLGRNVEECKLFLKLENSRSCNPISLGKRLWLSVSSQNAWPIFIPIQPKRFPWMGNAGRLSITLTSFFQTIKWGSTYWQLFPWTCFSKNWDKSKILEKFFDWYKMMDQFSIFRCKIWLQMAFIGSEGPWSLILW